MHYSGTLIHVHTRTRTPTTALVSSACRITLRVDASEFVETSYKNDPRRITTNSPLFFGGMMVGSAVVLSNTDGVQTSFSGCIGDVTVNNQ